VKKRRKRGRGLLLKLAQLLPKRGGFVKRGGVEKRRGKRR
jgi:hypothetical protein